MGIKASLSKDKKSLVLEIEFEQPVPSSSGKTMVIASTRGNQALDVQYNNQPLTLGLNLYYKLAQSAPVPAGV